MTVLLPDRFKGIPSLVASSFLFAGMAALARAASGHMATGALSFIRFFTGLVAVTLFYLAVRRGPDFRRPWLLAGRGLFGGLSVIAYFLAIDHLPVGAATLLNNSSPCYAVLFAAMFLGERLTLRAVVGVLTATAGAGIVAMSTLPPGQVFRLGVGTAAGFFSSIMSGAAITTVRALRSEAGSVDATSVLFSFSLIGSILSFPLALTGWSTPGAWVLLASLGVGLFSISAQFLMTHAYAYVSTATGTSVGLLTSVFAWALGVIFLGEPLNAMAALGTVICLAGVLIAIGVWPRSPGRLAT